MLIKRRDLGLFATTTTTTIIIIIARAGTELARCQRRSAVRDG
ncbi:MAG: hypothetical protein O7E53_01470 [Alphaproteobacteria bacterium]|nr:hypothetical protein [Alphaproteobacteria bacterium]